MESTIPSISSLGFRVLLTKEMVFQVGRKHASQLRIIGVVLMAALPILLLLIPGGHITGILAVITHLIGAAVCRWLFFAEAEHVVGLFYGRSPLPH